MARQTQHDLDRLQQQTTEQYRDRARQDHARWERQQQEQGQRNRKDADETQRRVDRGEVPSW